MNYESFQDIEVSKILNSNFIPIKVNIQERPDIGILYNKVCKGICGYGGNPLTILMTPDERVFFAGTYLPKNTMDNILGLLEVLKGVSNIWENKREQIIMDSKNIIYYLDKYYKGEGIEKSYCSNALENEYRKITIEENRNSSFIKLLYNYLFSKYKNKEIDICNKKVILELEKLIYKNSFLIASYLEAYNIENTNIFKEQDLNYIEDSLRNNILKYKNKIKKEAYNNESIISWIGLMIAALGKAYNIVDDKKYLKIADKTVSLIYDNMINSNIRGIKLLDDYAFTILGLIELYESSYSVEYLKKAISLNSEMISLFWDKDNHGFYSFSDKTKDVKELCEYDRPSGNSIAAYILSKLAKLTGDSILEDYARKEIQYISNNRKEGDLKYSFYNISASFLINNEKKLVCLLKEKKDINEVKVALKRKVDFNLTTIVVTKENKKEIESIAKFLKNYAIVNDKSTYYLCDNKEIKTPVNNIKEILA